LVIRYGELDWVTTLHKYERFNRIPIFSKHDRAFSIEIKKPLPLNQNRSAGASGGVQGGFDLFVQHNEVSLNTCIRFYKKENARIAFSVIDDTEMY